jgi:hypothetical protein
LKEPVDPVKDMDAYRRSVYHPEPHIDICKTIVYILISIIVQTTQTGQSIRNIAKIGS